MPKPNRIAIILLLMTLVVVSRAQIFPVHVTTQITPPYSPYLYDYVSPGSQRLMVQIRINDLQLSDYNVKLRVTIEGLGITIRTSQHYVPPPLMLGDPGVPTILWGDDLAPYFDINNLDFSGFSKSEFQQTRKLPEGVYRLTIEALDYNRGTTVSNKGTTVVWMIMNDPPLLNLPRKDSKAKIVDPTNIVFTWTPRHTASPNAAFTTDYIFRLVEIWPADRNPYDAFLTQLPLYEVTTNQSQIVYGIAEPALIPGRRYAWQVQAVDGEGKDLFRNQGRSEVYVFQFGDVVTTPANFRKENASVSSLSLRWEPSSIGDMPDQYRLRYKTTGSEHWTEMTTTQSWANINQLTTNASYDLQVRAEKGNQLSEYTTVLKASTLATPPENNFRCGDPANIEAPKTNTPVLLTLTPGDIVTCADFSAVVTEVTRSLNGSFSGKALMKVKMLNDASIEVTFSGNINNAYQFTSGGFVSTYEAGSQITQIIDDAYTIGEEKPEEPPTDTLQNQGTTILIDGVIDTVFVNDDGQIVVIDEDGNRDEFDQKKDKDGNVIGETVITGSDGESVVVGTDGEVKEGPSTALPDAIASASTIDYSVSFEPHAMQHYGFDQKTTFGDYETIKVGGKDYTVAWKSIESGRQDKITAFTTKDKFPDAIGFKTLTAPTPSQASDNHSRKELWLTGLSDGQTEYVSAYVRVKDSKDAEPKDVEVGRVNIQTYNKISNYVYIVPVNGAEVPANLATTLNTIYRQAVVGWSVTVEPTFTIDQSYIDGLDSEQSDWLSAFPDKMKEFQKQYKQSHNIDHDAYYIFLIKGKAFSSSGFMPFKRKYGYIFVDTTKDVTTTIAHELGHGAFRLRHTFSTDAFLAPERSTDNLMDYNNGTALKKFQWDLVRNQETLVSWLEEDEEVEFKSLLSSKYVFMHQGLSTKAYASKKGQDEFTQDAINVIDSNLYKLDTAGVKTFIYFAYIWFDQSKINRFDELVDRAFNRARDSIRINLGETDFNLLAIVNCKYDTSLANGLKTVSFREKFYPMIGLSKECTKSVNDYINSSWKKTFVNGLDDALKERASVMSNRLKDCKIVIPDRVEIANRLLLTDDRRYGRFILPDRATDVYVDCAEFVHDVLKEEGFVNIPSGDCVEQSKWYKTRELDGLCETGTKIEAIEVGDIILWKGTWEGSKEYAHTGIVVQRSEGSIHIINAGLQECDCDINWKKYTEKNAFNINVQRFETREDCYAEICKKQAIWKSLSYYSATTLSSEDHAFKYWARPKIK